MTGKKRGRPFTKSWGTYYRYNKSSRVHNKLLIAVQSNSFYTKWL